ncbi:hypothetical protein U1872_04210 [Sphingomonas sp. RB3P16]|uniref:hypothetical protein n=1 Tax=Parasphingomonas frigoris TaxID=3096163 RepID=UPI002FCA1989
MDRNATIRRLKVTVLPTTLLTRPPMGLGADSRSAGGVTANWQRRIGATVAVFTGVATGADLLSPLGLAAPLGPAGRLVLLATLAHAWRFP